MSQLPFHASQSSNDLRIQRGPRAATARWRLGPPIWRALPPTRLLPGAQSGCRDFDRLLHVLTSRGRANDPPEKGIGFSFLALSREASGEFGEPRSWEISDDAGAGGQRPKDRGMVGQSWREREGSDLAAAPPCATHTHTKTPERSVARTVCASGALARRAKRRAAHCQQQRPGCAHRCPPTSGRFPSTTSPKSMFQSPPYATRYMSVRVEAQTKPDSNAPSNKSKAGSSRH